MASAPARHRPAPAGRPALRGALAAVLALLALGAPADAGAAAATVFVVEGGGYGHGVGMSQWGAEGYARRGWDHRRILAHYYPRTRIGTAGNATVRVLLADGVPAVVVGSASPYRVVDARGRALRVTGALRLRPPLRARGETLVPPVTVEPLTSALTLEGTPYRGTLVVSRFRHRLSVVNAVPVESYLRGVVRCEMPGGWHAAAYEAQAIAARSYALASVRPDRPFDLFPDERSQVYGGIAAEHPESDRAVAATAGRVLTYEGRIALAYYASSSGGRTAAVEEAFPGLPPEPYLVSVPDPGDRISPVHRWRLALGPQALSRRVDLPVQRVRLRHDSSGRVTSVTLLGPAGAEVVSGDDLRLALGLRSNLFSIGVLSLARSPATVVYGRPLVLSGLVRGVGRTVLEERLPSGGWRRVRKVKPGPGGRFVAVVSPRRATAYRLASGRLHGPPVPVSVRRRIVLESEGHRLAGRVVPPAPVRIERRARDGWRHVRTLRPAPSGAFVLPLERYGRYRVSTRRGESFAASAAGPLRLPPIPHQAV